MVSKAYTLSVVFCGNSKHCMGLVLHGLLANLSAGSAGWLCRKSGMGEEIHVVFPLVCWFKTSPVH